VKKAVEAGKTFEDQLVKLIGVRVSVEVGSAV
jgi:hypothetical protein